MGFFYLLVQFVKHGENSIVLKVISINDMSMLFYYFDETDCDCLSKMKNIVEHVQKFMNEYSHK